MDYNQFAETIKQKYPQYKDVDNLTLSQKMVEKYPQYASKVTFDKKKSDVLGNVASGVSSFFTGKLSDALGADAAKIQAVGNGVNVLASGNNLDALRNADKSVSNFVDTPTNNERLGAGLQTVANVIPGIGKGASLGTKVLAGAGTGYAFDVGSKLQNENNTTAEAFVPGVGTVAGTVLPIASQLLGKLTEKGTKNLAQRLEQSNLRLTPKDKSFIEKSKPDFIPWLTANKITGNPEQRYNKIENIYNGLEDKVQGILKEGNKTIPKKEFIAAVKQIPEQFIDDPQLYSEAQSQVDRLVKTAQDKYSKDIPLDFVNSVKRNYGKRAFDKAAQQVTNETSYQISQNLYDLLQEKVPALEKINDEYSKVILAKKLMYKALGRQQLGIVGKIAASAIGGTIGSSVGGPLGAAGGIMIGQNAATAAIGTRSRSLVGAGLQKIYEKVQNAPQNKQTFNISRKMLIQILEQLKG